MTLARMNPGVMSDQEMRDALVHHGNFKREQVNPLVTFELSQKLWPLVEAAQIQQQQETTQLRPAII